MRKVLTVCALAALLWSCAKGPVEPGTDTPDTPDTPVPEENVVGPVTVSATLAESIVSGLPGWADGDQISLFGAGKVNRKLTLSSKNGSTGEFGGEGDSLGPYYGVYPYSDSTKLSGSILTSQIPAEQKIARGPIASGAFVAVARSDDKTLSFKNACSLLKIEIKDADISGILIQSVGGAALAGKIGVDAKTGVISKVEDPVSQISLIPAGDCFAPGTYYVSVIPGSYGDLRISLSRKTDVKKGFKTVEKAELGRSAALSLGSIDAKEMAWAYFINDYEDLKAWVADKDNWNKDGEAVTLTGDINMKDEPWTPLADSYPGVFDGAGHCISHVNIQSDALANVGFFGKNYAKEIKDVVFGSEDGRTYDGTSKIRNGYNTTSTSAYWSYTGIVTLPAADVKNVTNFIPISVSKGSNRSSRVGGIAAWATGKVTISGCHNYGEITVEEHEITSGSSYKYLAAAGILGGLNTASADVVISDCHNHAKVSSSNHSELGMGGIVAVVYHTSNSLVVENCSNEGRIELLYSATQNDNFSIGGIGGKLSGDPGKEVQVRNCTNAGEVYSEAVHQHYVGGIAGCGDGLKLSGCTNTGKVEIDHTAHPTTRFQCLGGILGGTTRSYGDNAVSDNVNKGAIYMKVASSGHDKTPSSTSKFYGVNVGGILGMATKVVSLERNHSEGGIDAQNAFSASNASYPALVHAGGIVGYDLDAIGNFSDNEFTGSLSAATTKATSVPSEVYAGGIIGRQKSSTLLGGSGKGSITTQTADSGGKQFAGSVAGYNGDTIGECIYGGTVNGAAASEANIVGGGNPPGGPGTDPIEGGTFAVSESSISFPGTGFSKQDLVVTAGDKAVSISAEGLDWLKTENIPSGVEAGKGVSIPIIPRTGNIDEQRSGTLTVKEADGETRTVAISQGTIPANVEGFPARWEIAKGVTYTEGNAAGQRWLREGIAETVKTNDITSTSPGVGYISAGSTTGNKLVYSVAPSGTQNISIGNMDEGDYIQFSVPTVSLPAGTDIDFMVTINTNNNKTPKYWLFEYWDDGKWNARPRYTATEDPNVKYSLDVYDYDSKNHRTYITTFRLSKAVNNAFVKMRLRAVGKINCSGGTLVPTPNAYMNFPCTTYRSCEIVAYPGIPAKETTPVKILQLGNSFTYYHGSAFKLKQICRQEGHATDVRINVKGSQEFEHHLDELPFSQRLVAEGGYDKAIIQDGSYFHAEFGAGSASVIQGVDVKYTPEQILALTKRMSAAIKEKSPNSKVILESVWSYPYKSVGNYLGFGSFEEFDKMQWKGSNDIAAADPNVDIVSPIGLAFAKARSDYGFNSSYNWLLYTDNYHPNRYGSYLKACVNYLILFGEPFGDNPADCDVPHDIAVRLRQAATEIFFGKQ